MKASSIPGHPFAKFLHTQVISLCVYNGVNEKRHMLVWKDSDNYRVLRLFPPLASIMLNMVGEGDVRRTSQFLYRGKSQILYCM
jgi:hypothetical protein